MRHDLINRLFCCKAAKFGQRSGSKSLGRNSSELDPVVSHGRCQGLRVCICGNERHAGIASRDHGVDRIAAAAADADNCNPGRPSTRSKRRHEITSSGFY